MPAPAPKPQRPKENANKSVNEERECDKKGETQKLAHELVSAIVRLWDVGLLLRVDR